MNDPPRLRDDELAPGFERELLRSATLDREPDDGAARALAALGIGVGAAAGAALLNAGSTPPMGAMGAGTGIGVGLIAKVLFVVLIVGGAAVGAVTISNRLAVESPCPVSLASATVGAAAPQLPSLTVGTEAPSARLSSEEPLTSPSDSAIAPAPSVPPVSASSRPTLRYPCPTSPSRSRAENVSPTPKAPSLAQELAFIDRARAAMKRGDLGAAERALDEHDAQFRNGPLAAEATVARIELLLARGDAERARALGQRFLSEHPGTTHERHVRNLLQRMPLTTNP